MKNVSIKSPRLSPQQIRMTDSLPPLLKWPGGKRRLVPDINPHFGDVSGRYYEPFLGGGAMFFNSPYERATLSDLNERLIGFYQQVRENPESVIRAMGRMKNSEEHYYAERKRETGGASASSAARFLYLTSLSFNGIYRQNLDGKFNVPYGKRLGRNWFDADLIRIASSRLQGVDLLACDFETATLSAMKGDLIYFDPPYTVAHSNNGFVKYNARIFSWDDQQRLARVAVRLVERGCRVIVSNADHASIRELYPAFRESLIERSSVIAASSSFRRVITESLFVGG